MSIFRLGLIAIGAAMLTAPIPGAAQPQLDAPATPTVAQTGSAHYRFERFNVPSADGKRMYDIQVGIPKRSVPARGFPVVYMLDGGAAIDALDEPLLARLDQGGSPPVLVAIGYAGHPRFDTDARAFDYTPADAAKAQVVDDRGRPGGGASAFLALIETGIKPRVRKLVRIDRRRQTLWGHSYGGLLVVHAATGKHADFQQFAAADPALWWNYGSALRGAQAFAAQKAHRPRSISIMVGGSEQPSGNARPGMRGAMRLSVPASAIRVLAEKLGASGHHIRFARCEGVSHGAMFRISLVRSLLDVATNAESIDALSCPADAPPL